MGQWQVAIMTIGYILFIELIGLRYLFLACSKGVYLFDCHDCWLTECIVAI